MSTAHFCFHHTDRETGRRCVRCDRYACPECLVQASVGSQCWQCVKAGRPPLTERVRRRSANAGPVITKALIAVNLVVFLVVFGGVVPESDLGVFAAGVAGGEWWRLITSGFLHFGVLHVVFNMLLLYQLGTALEIDLGKIRFSVLYTTALLGGSFGALALSPEALTGGASGAVFGLVGATLVAIRARGMDVRQSGLLPLLVINLVATFVIPGISIGGHIGGLVAGALAASAMYGSHAKTGITVSLALAAALFAGSLYLASLV